MQSTRTVLPAERAIKSRLGAPQTSGLRVLTKCSIQDLLLQIHSATYGEEMQVLCGVLCLVSVLSLTAALPLAPYEEVQDRNSRAVGSHDYVLTLFSKRRSFIDANCNATMNGFPVSQHICRTNAIKSFMAYTPGELFVVRECYVKCK